MGFPLVPLIAACVVVLCTTALAIVARWDRISKVRERERLPLFAVVRQAPVSDVHYQPLAIVTLDIKGEQEAGDRPVHQQQTQHDFSQDHALVDLNAQALLSLTCQA